MSKFGELVLVAGDSCFPFGESDIPWQFKKMLIPGKFRHVILTGNLCTEKELSFYKSLCNDVVSVRGCWDDSDSVPEMVVREVCGYKILAMSGSNMLVNTTDVLVTTAAERSNCDIAVFGGTHKLSVEKKEKIVYVNPGSLSGASHPQMMVNEPSFLLLALKPDELTVFTYQVKDGKLEVGKTVFPKDE